MSSPAGHCALHGGSRCTYTGRSVRQLPVLLASDEPGSSVIAKGLSMSEHRGFVVEELEAADVAIGVGLDCGDHLRMACTAEQVREALLRPQVGVDRHPLADLG